MRFWKGIWERLLTKPGRMLLVGIILLFAGRLMYDHLGLKGFGLGVAIVGAILWALVFPLIALLKIIRHALPEETSAAAMIVIAITVIMGFLVLPSLLLALASPGSTRKLIETWIHDTGGGSGGVVASLVGIADSICLFVSPALLVIFPEALRRRLPWENASGLAKTVLPAWLATAAAVSTWLFVVLQDTTRGVLVGTPVVPLMVAALGAAALLAPVYQRLARSCWEYGVAMVFDPKRWRDTWKKVFPEIKGAFLAARPDKAAGEKVDPDKT